MGINLKEICFNITRRCNLHCEYCYVYDYINQKNSNMMLDLSLEKITTIVRSSSVETVFLTGGEPFMHPEIRDIIDYFSYLGVKINIATNGLLLDEQMCQFLSHKNVTLLISLREKCDEAFRIMNLLDTHKIEVICYHIPRSDSPKLLSKLLLDCPSVKKIKLLYDSKNPKGSSEWFALLYVIYNSLKTSLDSIDVDVEISFLPQTNIVAKDKRRGAFDRIQVSTEGLFYYCPLLVCNTVGSIDLSVPKCNPQICPVLSKHLDDEKYASICCFLVSSLEDAIKIGKYGGAIK